MYWTDDPVRDQLRYEDELESRPCLHCVICGASLYEGEDYYLVDGDELCEDCMKEEYRKRVRLDD